MVGTVTIMSAALLLSTPFVSSWIGAARPGHTMVGDWGLRVPAWASWAVKALEEVTSDDRTYPALMLPGRFYTRTDIPAVQPHLEIPVEVLTTGDSLFAHRLAAVGNGLLFPQWVPTEIHALRRVMFLHEPGDPRDMLEAFEVQRPAILAAVAEQLGRLAPRWEHLQHLLATDPAAVTDALTQPATSDELNGFVPALAPWKLAVEFSGYLHRRSGGRAARNIGVWVLESAAGRCRLPVITPRLTYSSLWRDDLFDPYVEPTAALVVRGAMFARLLNLVAVAPVRAVTVAVAADEGTWLRAQPARQGVALPHASIDAAVTFLQAYPTTSLAFDAVEKWVQRAGAQLTVERTVHAAAHTTCLTALQRSEELPAAAVDELLPLVWQDGRLARLTIARRRS